MSLPKTETFTNADGTALQTHDANWSIKAGGFSINTNACYSTGSGGGMAAWIGDTFGVAQYGKCKCAASNNNNTSGRGVAIRVQSSGVNGYIFVWNGPNDNSSWLIEAVSGSWADIGSDRGTFALNDTIELRAPSNGTLQLFKNGAQLGSDISDASHSGGSAGIGGWNGASTERIDDWEGGNLGGGAARAGMIMSGRTLRGLTFGGLLRGLAFMAACIRGVWQ